MDTLCPTPCEKNPNANKESKESKLNMAKMSFTEAAQDTQVPAVTPQPETTALATQSDPPLGIGHSGADVDRSDMIVPRLMLVQSVGDMSNHHDPGSLVLGEEAHQKIGGKDSPINIVCLSTHKAFVENLDYGDESMPRTFKSLQEVAEAGLTTKWVGETKPGAVELLTCTILIECPEGAGEETQMEFPYEFEGKDYALSFWNLRKAGYKYAGKQLLSSIALKKIHQIHEGIFTVTPTRVKAGDNWIWVPKTKLTGLTSPAFRQFAQELVS